MRPETLTFFSLMICCSSAEKPGNVSSPNIIIMLMDDVSYFLCPRDCSSSRQFCYSWRTEAGIPHSSFLSMGSAFGVYLKLCSLSTASVALLNKQKLLINSPFIPLLFRWVGGTWGCLASPLKKPPTWMPWLLMACCFLISTLPTHSVHHVSHMIML